MEVSDASERFSSGRGGEVKLQWLHREQMGKKWRQAWTILSKHWLRKVRREIKQWPQWDAGSRYSLTITERHEPLNKEEFSNHNMAEDNGHHVNRTRNRSGGQERHPLLEKGKKKKKTSEKRSSTCSVITIWNRKEIGMALLDF